MSLLSSEEAFCMAGLMHQGKCKTGRPQGR